MTHPAQGREPPDRTDEAPPGARWFEEEVVRILPDLMDGARALTASEADAEDLVAQSVAQGWARIGDLRDPSRLRGWLFCILRNAFFSGKRKARVRPDEVPLPPEGQGAPGPGRGDLETGFSLFEQMHAPVLLWADNPEQRLLDGLLRQDLHEALESLPAIFRDVVHLVDVRGFRYAEVADALRIPVGTVRSRLARGRSLLQAHLWEHAVDRGLRPSDPSKGASHG